MRSLGIWLIIFAIGSVLLPLVGMQFILVSWIDTWGATVGWIIRAVMLAAGIGALVAHHLGMGNGGGRK